MVKGDVQIREEGSQALSPPENRDRAELPQDKGSLVGAPSVS